jgi:hypothetical protein
MFRQWCYKVLKLATYVNYDVGVSVVDSATKNIKALQLYFKLRNFLFQFLLFT